MKSENLYCDFCRSVISNKYPPSESNWQKFKDCRCLSKWARSDLTGADKLSKSWRKKHGDY